MTVNLWQLYQACTADVRHGKGCPERNDMPGCSCGLDAFETALRQTAMEPARPADAVDPHGDSSTGKPPNARS